MPKILALYTVDIIHHIAVLWIRIGSDTHHLPDPYLDRVRHPGHAHPDLADSDRYQLQATEKVIKGGRGAWVEEE